ncbi:MAG: hypothetical protein MZV63_63190 [Marinilabiliales bacterium]|nr:hypothetical protein [Marinilabiliales bacterium]
MGVDGQDRRVQLARLFLDAGRRLGDRAGGEDDGEDEAGDGERTGDSSWLLLQSPEDGHPTRAKRDGSRRSSVGHYSPAVRRNAMITAADGAGREKSPQRTEMTSRG